MSSVAAILLLILNISMASEWILRWWIVKDTSLDSKMRVLKNKKRNFKKGDLSQRENNSQKTLFT